MKILVTGGCGFIGSNFIRYMLDKYPDCEILNLDLLTYCVKEKTEEDVKKKFEGLPDPQKDRFKFRKHDICDKKTSLFVKEYPDAIINFAAETHVDRSIKYSDSDAFIHTNVQGVKELLEAAKKYNVKKFIQISTDEVYGSLKRGSFKETSLLHPNSPYAASKAAADHLALAYYTTFKTPVVITRSSNNFGPYQFPEKVIPLFITNLLENKKVPLYGDGMNVRDWLYVMDNCRAIDTVLRKGKPGEIYNIGGGYEIPNIKLTRMILRLLNKSDNMIKYVPDRLGHDRRYSLDSTKIKKLGWRPTKDFNIAIKETIEWYKNNRSWWENMK